jgi:CrcB protein
VKLNALMLVGLGGFLGSIARFVVGTVVADRWGRSWPNITGCFVIAFFLTLTTERVTINEALGECLGFTRHVGAANLTRKSSNRSYRTLDAELVHPFLLRQLGKRFAIGAMSGLARLRHILPR